MVHHEHREYHALARSPALSPLRRDPLPAGSCCSVAHASEILRRASRRGTALEPSGGCTRAAKSARESQPRANCLKVHSLEQVEAPTHDPTGSSFIHAG